MITEKFNGSVESVEKEIKAYFDQYPKFGYSTKIVQDTVKDGVRVVYIERSRTCD